MNTQSIINEFSGKTFSSHEDFTQWLEKRLKQLELDAFKAGMTKAAEVLTAKPVVNILMGSFTGARAIIAARDNLKELP